MNIKRATNPQLPTTESENKKKKRKEKIKQTTRTGTESQIRRSSGGLSAGRGKGDMEEKVQGLRSIIGRYRTDGELLRIVQEIEKPKNSYA